MTDLPLTDDQLRQVAAHVAAEYGRDQTNDTMGIGEMLDGVLAECQIELPTALDPDCPGWDTKVYDAVIDRVAGLIRDATITVTWLNDEPGAAIATAARALVDALQADGLAIPEIVAELAVDGAA